MRRIHALVLLCATLLTVAAARPAAQDGGGQAPAPRPPAAAPVPPASPASPVVVGPSRTLVFPATMKELMVDLIFPTSNELFYVSREEPKNGMDWARLELNFLMLAESANVLMAPPRARDQGQWMADARLLLDVGLKAYRLAKAKDYQGLMDLNDELYESCQACHVNYRPGYRRRP
jgi:hypothetical protein